MDQPEVQNPSLRLSEKVILGCLRLTHLKVTITKLTPSSLHFCAQVPWEIEICLSTVWQEQSGEGEGRGTLCKLPELH